jgi:hypothetical protein
MLVRSGGTASACQAERFGVRMALQTGTSMNARQAEEIRRYLETGRHDELADAWDGGNALERMASARLARRAALCAEVRERAASSEMVSGPAPNEDLSMLARTRVDRMVRGLFPKSEQEVILRLLEQSVVIVSPANVERILVDSRWDHSAWVLANLYLESIDAPPLSPEEGRLLGVSEETTCYLSLKYFQNDDPLADCLVHEAAHVFHNCKRRTVGLPEKRNQEWLLAIEYRQRETFAYSCEAYSAICARGATAREREQLLRLLSEQPGPADERVDPEEFLDIVREACRARNGWKRILARCAPLRARRAPSAIVAELRASALNAKTSRETTTDE